MIEGKVGGVHLHVDTAGTTVHVAQVEDLARRLNGDGLRATVTQVVEAVAGPQRMKIPETYALHTPGTGGREEFGALLTVGLPSRERTVESLNWLLPSVMSQEGVVVEVERVIAVAESNGSWREAPRHEVAPIDGAEVGVPTAKAHAVEVHYAVDLACDETRSRQGPPVELRSFLDDTLKENIEVGGWFLFKLPGDVWAYRSNMFCDLDVSLEELSRHQRILVDCAKRHGYLYRVRIFVEQVLGIWRGDGRRQEPAAMASS